MRRNDDVADIVHETRGMLWVVLKIVRTVLVIVSITAAVAAGAFAVYKLIEKKRSNGCYCDDEFDFDDEMLSDHE